MNSVVKAATAVVLGGALVAGSVTASSARSWRPWAAAGAGFVAGAAIGAAAANANANAYYGPRYYEPGYAYEPAYGGPAYQSYGYQGYAPYSYRDANECVQDEGYGRTTRCN
jgi:hypothetical protein